MAQETVAKFWIKTRDEIENVLLHERLTQSAEPTKDVLVVQQLVADLYCRYVHLCRNLSRCYDQTLQVQKRKVLKQLLECASCRLQELSAKLREMELSQHVYIDGTLQELHLIPDDVRAIQPCYFPLARPQELDNLLRSSSLAPFAPPSDVSTCSSSSESETDQPIDPRRPVVLRDRVKERRVRALTLITAHEKARQARVRQTNFRLHPDVYYPKPIEDPIPEVLYEFCLKPGQPMLVPVKRTVYNWDFYTKKKNVIDFPYYEPPQGKGRQRAKRPIANAKIQPVRPKVTAPIVDASTKEELHEKIVKVCERLLRNRAARQIQRCWRRYSERQRCDRERYERSKFLGLFVACEPNLPLAQMNAKVRDSEATRRAKRVEYDQQFLQAIVDEKARILKTSGPGILEDITDFVRGWFAEWYKEAHAFDTIPELLDGGTVLIVRGETLTPLEYLEVEKQKQLNKLKTAEQKKKEAEAKQKAKEQEKEKKLAEKERLRELAREKRELEKKEGKTYNFTDREFMTNAYLTLEETIERYEKDWAFVDEMSNKQELPIMGWITLDKFAEVHQELHAEVHQLLTTERELLQMALSKDMKKKYKPPKVKKRRRKGKKGGGKKGKKGAPDLTADRTVESLYEELLQKQAIKSYRKCSVDDFIGDYNYAAYEKRNIAQQDPPPGMGEVRDIIRSYLLGMGPLAVPKPKSICLLGPPGYGKTLLLQAICTETDSILLDLSVETMAQVSAADMKFFLQSVLKVARTMQPTVIAIENAHRLFYKKIPANEKPLDPTKLGKVLFKLLVKQIKADERILLLGTSGQPWLSKMGPFKKCFEKFVLIPRTDYGTVQMLWRQQLNAKVGVRQDLDLSALSVVTRGYSAGQIRNCVVSVVNLRRRMRFGRQPLVVQELLDYFLNQNPPENAISEKEYEKYTKWYRKVDKLAKQRVKMIRERQLLAELAAAKAKKK